MLIRASGLSPGHDADFTCPLGQVCVVRDVDAYSSAGISASEAFLIDQLTGGTIANFVVSPVAHGNPQWRGRQVFNQGESVVFSASNGTWDVRVSGYLLDS